MRTLLPVFLSVALLGCPGMFDSDESEEVPAEAEATPAVLEPSILQVKVDGLTYGLHRYCDSEVRVICYRIRNREGIHCMTFDHLGVSACP